MKQLTDFPEGERAALLYEFQQVWRGHIEEIERYRRYHKTNDEALISQLASDRDKWWEARGIQNPFIRSPQ